MATKIQIKRGTKTNLPALSPGEFGLTTDTEELYIGGNNGNIRMGKNGESSTPNATATHSDSVVAITAPAGVNLISFYAPSDFSGDDTYTVNGSAVTLTDLNGNAIYDGWKEGAPVQLILKGAQAFFKSGGGLNGDLPPINPNMSGSLEDGVFTVTADKLPVAQANELAGAEWYYGDHVPARPGDGTKVELSRNELVVSDTPKALSEYAAGDIVKIRENNAAAEFIVAMHNYEPSLNGEGRTLLVRKDIYDLRAWDAALQKIYSSSDIDDFANTGYKNLYSAFVQGLMGTTKFPCMSQRGGSVVTVEKSVFILSMAEYGKTHRYAPVEGSSLAIAESLLISDYNGEPTDHYTRTITTNDNISVWRINATGGNNYGSAEKEYGFRPCFTFPSTTLFGSESNELIEDASGVQTLADTTNLGDSAAGSTVTLMENGAATEFLVLQHGYPVSGNGNTLLRRKDAVAQMAWDSNGVNAYSDASADEYLSTDYIGRFTGNMQSMLQMVNISSAAGNGNTTVNTIPRKAFILSYAEAGFPTHANAPAEGTAIPYFDSDAKRIVQLNGAAVNQWLRTPYGSSTTNAWIILNTGAASSGAVTGQYGIAPCIVLKSDTQVNPDGSIVESDNSPVVTVSIPWAESGYCYCRQFPYNSKHQYQTQLVGAVATNDPIYGTSLDRVLENNSWAKIAEASESGIAADAWQVGDTKDIVVDGETLTVEIVGFNHDDLASGGKAGITFGLKNLMADTRKMNDSDYNTGTNAGGFTGSDTYEWLQGPLLNSLPSELRAVLKSVNKKTSAGGQSSTINTNAMKIFLFSEIEIFGSVTYSKSGEGSQYSRFATAASRIKRLSNGSGSVISWWERSPRGNSSDRFCIVNGSGGASHDGARISEGVCFGFCV